MVWEPFVLAVVMGLVVSAIIYFVVMWPQVEPDDGDDIEDGGDPPAAAPGGDPPTAEPGGDPPAADRDDQAPDADDPDDDVN